MKLLLDTHFVQWLGLSPGRLNRSERGLIEDPRHELFISAISIWEMRIKWQAIYRSGQRKGEADPEAIIAALAAAQLSYDELPLRFAHCTATLRDPLDHNDPFDRFLLAQAQVEGLRLLTRDAKFEGHPLALIA